MIHVLVKRSDQVVQLLHVEGHANSRTLRGGRYDLVCCAVSTLMNNLLEGFDLLGKGHLTSVNVKDNSVRVQSENEPTQQVLMQAAIRTLEGIEEQHAKFLEIHMEV